jgi:hypothetical protein
MLLICDWQTSSSFRKGHHFVVYLQLLVYLGCLDSQVRPNLANHGDQLDRLLRSIKSSAFRVGQPVHINLLITVLQFLAYIIFYARVIG